MLVIGLSVRDAEGGETTPSFGHPSNVRRGETTPSFGHPSNVRRGRGGTAFGAERSEATKGLLKNLPISLLIGGKGGAAPRPCRTSRTKRSEVERVRRGHALNYINHFLEAFAFSSKELLFQE